MCSAQRVRSSELGVGAVYLGLSQRRRTTFRRQRGALWHTDRASRLVRTRLEWRLTCQALQPDGNLVDFRKVVCVMRKAPTASRAFSKEAKGDAPLHVLALFFLHLFALSLL